jgi:hypothetical protein
MRYMLLIYTGEADEAAMSQAEQEKMYTAYGAYTTEIRERGVMHSGEALQPTGTAKTVSVRSGKTVTTDGPYAETKEQLGGFYIVDCKDEAEAVELAAKIPGAQHGHIEVRPVMEFG